MSAPLSAIARELIAAGLSGEALVAALERLESAGKPERSTAAVRQARYRERRSERGMNGDGWRKISAAIMRRDDGVCGYCQARAQGVDHIQPLILGGTHDDNNLVAACAACNGGKSGKTLEEWRGQEWAAAWRHNRGITVAFVTTPSPTPLSQEPTPFSPPKGGQFPPSAVTPSPDEPSAFDAFWQAYPAKVGKGAARKAFDRARPKIKSRDPIAAMLSAIEAQKRSRKWREGIIPNPATWLNEERWTDGEIIAAAQPPPSPTTPEQRAKRLRHHADTGEWFPAWGPEPETQNQAKETA